MGAVAVSLAVGKLLDIRWRASALGASGDTANGVIGLTNAGARDVVAFGNAANVIGSTFIVEYSLVEEACQLGLFLHTALGTLDFGAGSGGRRVRGGAVSGGSEGN